jgi:hypothetical protein
MAMHATPIGARLVALAQEWDEVEGRLKQAEIISTNVVIPALEELHYAGRRLVDLVHYLCASQDDKESTQDRVTNLIFEAEQNIVRARHDIVDAIVSTIHTYLTHLADDVGETLLLGCFPKYSEMRGRIDEVNDFVILSRQERRRRPEMYDDVYKNYLPEIIELFNAIRASQPRIEAQIKKDEKDAQKEKQRQRWRDCIAIASIGLAVAGSALAYWFWKNPVLP